MSGIVKLKKIPKELKENKKGIIEFTSIENKHRKLAGKGDYSEQTNRYVQLNEGYTAYKIANILGITFKSKKSFTPNPDPIERAILNLGIETSGVRTNTKTGYNNGGHKREIITTHDVYPVTSVYAIKKEIEGKSKILSKGSFSYDGVEYRVIF